MNAHKMRTRTVDIEASGRRIKWNETSAYLTFLNGSQNVDGERARTHDNSNIDGQLR